MLHHDNVLSIVADNRWLASFKQDHAHFFSGAVSQLLYSQVHGMEYRQWMFTAHASGIEARGGSLLFSADSGQGKSTLAALLAAHGYNLLSDDLIALDTRGKAYGLPSALSVKKGSINILAAHFPELANIQSEQSFSGKEVFYLPVKNRIQPGTGYPVKAFVFVRYQPGAKLQFGETSKKEALQNLLKESWVNPQPEIIKAFFNWFGNTRFYHMVYDEWCDALKTVNKLMA